MMMELQLPLLKWLMMFPISSALFREEMATEDPIRM